jgi:hypothetical protein
MKLRIARFNLLGVSFLYIVFGIMFFLDPAKFASGLGYTNITAEGLIEIRAIYGGMELALGFGTLFLLKKNQAIAASYMLLITLIGFAGGRLVGIMIDGFLGNHLWFLILELSLTFTIAWSLKQYSKKDAQS